MPAEERFRAMGADVHVVVDGPPGLLDRARARVGDLDRRWSRFRPDSEVSQLNAARGALTVVSPVTFDLLRHALDGYRRTYGAFDPSVLGDVIRAGYDDDFDRLPADRDDGPDSDWRPGLAGTVLFPASRAVMLPPGVGFDPGGIGKGLAADLAAAELVRAGAAGACVNVGGDLRVLGTLRGSPVWRLAIDHPDRSPGLASVLLTGAGLATTSTARRHWRIGGERRHHLLDPSTGRPATSGLVAVSVVARSAWEAEVLAKAGLLAGPAHCLTTVAAAGADALAVTDDGAVLAAPCFAVPAPDLAGVRPSPSPPPPVRLPAGGRPPGNGYRGAMPILSVWAPRAEQVDAVVAGEHRPLQRGERGWWTLAEPVPAGTDYAFCLDGADPLPDPRSPWQPAGPDGPSRTVDHDAFAWTDSTWRGCHLPSAALYELHVGTFSSSGTFDGAIGHLDHLVDLGIDAVELLPVAEASGERGWGYDGVDLFAPHHAYGGPDGLKRLVDACHARGIGVVLDVVYNHLGPAGNYLARYGPYFTDKHVTNWGDAINVDGPDSDEVRAFIVDNARSWLRDYHIDGLRLDAVHAIVDESALHILETLSDAVDSLAARVRRPLFLIAESDLNDPRFVRPRLAGGYGLDSAWADEFHHAIHAALTGDRNGYYVDFGPLSMVATALRQAWVYAGTYSPHRRRVHGRSPTGLQAGRFCVCIQNHDQVGNRAVGERLGHLTTPGRARIAAALLLLSPFVPLLFAGEEWAASSPFQYFTDHQDPALGRAVTEGRTHEFSSFGWEPETVPDPQDPVTFARSKLDWAEVGSGDHAAMLHWYRSLLTLRRTVPDVTAQDPGRTSVTVDEDQATLVLRRGMLTVAVNLGASAVALPAPAGAEVALASPASSSSCSGGRVEVEPDGVVALVG